MAHDSLSFDYRKSHVSPDKGVRYDRLYAPGRALAFYFDHFERPYIEAQFERVKEERVSDQCVNLVIGRWLQCLTGLTFELGRPASSVLRT